MANDEVKNVIAFMNMKGGVGKTTLCVNLADCLARHFNKKILIIDLDPQTNATQYLISSRTYNQEINKYGKTIVRVFKRNKIRPNITSGPSENITDTSNLEYKIKDNLYIIPGHLKLSQIDTDDESQHVLNRFIEKNKLKDKYDYIFLDSPPTESIFTEAAFYASNFYIIPVKTDHLSSLGIHSYMKSIEDRNEGLPHKIHCMGIVLMIVDLRSKHDIEIMEQVRKEFMFDVFDNFIKRSSLVPRSSRRNKCIYDIPSLKQIIIDIGQEFLNRI